MPKCGPARQGQRSGSVGDQGNDDVTRNLKYTRLLICMNDQRSAPSAPSARAAAAAAAAERRQQHWMEPSLFSQLAQHRLL